MSINNRWFQLVASLIAMIMIANLQYAWTLFVEPMQKQTGWGLSDIQFAFALFILFQTWVQPLDGWLIDRLGPAGSSARPACCAGWAGQAWDTPRRCQALHVVLRGGHGRGVRLQRLDRLGLKWFKERRGLASGIMAAGFGGGTALFIPFISSMIAVSRLPGDVRRDRPVSRPRDPRRRAVPEASAGAARRTAPGAAAEHPDRQTSSRRWKCSGRRSSI